MSSKQDYQESIIAITSIRDKNDWLLTSISDILQIHIPSSGIPSLEHIRLQEFLNQICGVLVNHFPIYSFSDWLLFVKNLIPLLDND